MQVRVASPSLKRLQQLLLLALQMLFLTACASRGDETSSPQLTVSPLTVDTATPERTVAAVVQTPTVMSPPTVAPTWTASPTMTPSPEPTATPTPGCQESGQLVQGRFASALARPDLAYRIYLPPCYGQDDKVYPALYMLPGNIHDDSIWDQLGLDEAAESGIEAGLLPPMLIVMPEGGAVANQTSGGPYSYEGVIMNELRPFIESSYCAWPEAAGRAIGGLSRGGYWALEIAFRHPHDFSSVGGHSAALVDSYAGPDLDPKYTASTSDLSALRIHLDAGQSDWYLGPLQILHNNLLTAGKDHEWIIQEGGHDSEYWAAHVADYLAWYAEPWPMDRNQLPRCESRLAG